MKFTKILTVLTIIGTSLAHEFETCGTNDHLHLSNVDFSNENVKPGTDLKVSIKGRPDVTVSKDATAKVEVRIHGIKLYSETVKLCEEFEVNCPLESGKDFTAIMTYAVPSVTPAIDLHLSVKVSDNGKDIGCFETKVDVDRSNIAQESEISDPESLIPKKSEISDHHFRYLFKLWLKEHQIHIDDFEMRLAIFTHNFLTVKNHNEGDHTFTKAINAFGHLTPDEFAENHLGYNKAAGYRKRSGIVGNLLSTVKTAFSRRSLKDLPDSVDWVKAGAVNNIVSQGTCGSCWAFSAISSIESAFFIKTGKLVKFSEEQLVACDKGSFGCQGGLMDQAFQWVEDHGGMCLDKDFPYTSGSGTVQECSTCTVVPGSAVTSFVEVPADSETDMMEAVSKQPVSVALEADQQAFQFYKSGVLSGRCGSKLDHGVVIVGYGTSENGIDFWKVRNSWGDTWGEDGYIRVQRGKVGPFPWDKSECGILKQGSYPVFA
jgi:hypothetical protein